MDSSDKDSQTPPPSAPHLEYSPLDPHGHLKRRVFLGETANRQGARDGGTRTRERTEYVAVPRQVKVHEKVTTIPIKRQYQEYEPKWTVQTIKRQIPREKVEYEDHITDVNHKRVIDEYVEVPYDAGTEVKCIPRVEVQERDIQVSVPRIKWVTKEEVVPETREVVRYVDADHNIERVIRYVPDTPPRVDQDGAPSAQSVSAGAVSPGGPTSKSPRGFQGREGLSPGFPSGSYVSGASELDSPLQGVVLPREARSTASGLDSKVPVTIDIPVPFMVPKPICIPVEVPLIRFQDNFVPVPGRRHVTPKLTFTDEVYDVPCIKEKPILVVQDYMKPVPVDTHIRVREKDVKVKPIDPTELSQCDIHAMWMRVNADLLENYKLKHGGKLPRGHRADESEKVPPTEGDWETTLEKEKVEAEAELANREDGEETHVSGEDLGPLPLHPGHPLMMTFLQNQWMQNDTTTTHGMYGPEFFRMHYAALNAQLDPQCHQVNLTDHQVEELGPMPHEQLPNPWNVVSLLKEAERNKSTQNTLA